MSRAGAEASGATAWIWPVNPGRHTHAYLQVEAVVAAKGLELRLQVSSEWGMFDSGGLEESPSPVALLTFHVQPSDADALDEVGIAEVPVGVCPPVWRSWLGVEGCG